MQIGSGQSALSLAVLKTLGVQPQAAAAGAETAGAGAAVPGVADAKTAAPTRLEAAAPTPAPAQSGCDQDSARNFPRGSFIDIRA